MLDTHVVLENFLWCRCADEPKPPTALRAAIESGDVIPIASADTLLELAGVASRPIRERTPDEMTALALEMLAFLGGRLLMIEAERLQRAADALAVERILCRDGEDQKLLVLARAAADLCGAGRVALITRDKLLRKAAKRLRSPARGGVALLLPEEFGDQR